MSNWQRKLDLKDVWNQTTNEEMTILELAKIIVDRLEKLPKFNNHIDRDTESIIKAFKDFIDIEENDTAEFDYLMNELYDWGDISLFGGKKVCWIATRF